MCGYLSPRPSPHRRSQCRDRSSRPQTPSSPLYSQGVKAGAQVLVSGTTGIEPSTGDLAGDTVQDQTRQALANCEAILRAGGAASTPSRVRYAARTAGSSSSGDSNIPLRAPGRPAPRPPCGSALYARPTESSDSEKTSSLFKADPPSKACARGLPHPLVETER